jgi:ribosomal protein S18 acetylase RimI-like enzyme
MGLPDASRPSEDLQRTCREIDSARKSLHPWMISTVDSCAAFTLDAVRDGVHAAGNPWFDHLFGSPEIAQTNLARWIRRRSSEVYASRCVLFAAGSADESCIAGFCAIAGGDVVRCRSSDGLAVVAAAPPNDRQRLLERMTHGRELFPLPADSEYYLSKIWISPGERGKGYAAVVLDHFLDEGARLGFRRWRLDVCVDNAVALRLYASAGFQVEAERSAGPLRYIAMVKSNSI